MGHLDRGRKVPGLGARRFDEACRPAASSCGLQHLQEPRRPIGEIVALAVGVSAAVGIGFGLYLAHRASRMDPLTALGHE